MPNLPRHRCPVCKTTWAAPAFTKCPMRHAHPPQPPVQLALAEEPRSERERRKVRRQRRAEAA